MSSNNNRFQPVVLFRLTATSLVNNIPAPPTVIYLGYHNSQRFTFLKNSVLKKLSLIETCEYSFFYRFFLFFPETKKLSNDASVCPTFHFCLLNLYSWHRTIRQCTSSTAETRRETGASAVYHSSGTLPCYITSRFFTIKVYDVSSKPYYTSSGNPSLPAGTSSDDACQVSGEETCFLSYHCVS